MPRGFSDRERETIRKNLLACGRERIIAVGMHKTSVGELARAAHISKGAFYQFFTTKESLFITLFEEAERDIRQQMRVLAAQTGNTPQARMRAFLTKAFRTYLNNPLLQRFTRNDLEALMRGVSPEQLQHALTDDVEFFTELIGIWRSTGLALACTPQELTGVMQSLSLIVLYAEDFGGGYKATVPFMIEALADRLVKFE